MHEDITPTTTEQSVQKKEETEIAIQQTIALANLSQAVTQIAEFLTGGGLQNLLSGYARSQAVKDILGGLAAHDGRKALDARVVKQNALEITEVIEAVMDKYHERLNAKGRDTEIHDAEADFNKSGR